MSFRFSRLLRQNDFSWSRSELFLMRLGMTLVILWSATDWRLAPFKPEAEKLNGFARLVPLEWLFTKETTTTLAGLSAVCLAVFVAGISPAVFLLPPLFAICSLGALRNSKGDIGHSTQVAAMALLAMWIAYVAGAVREKSFGTSRSATHRQAMLAALLILSASYTASGIVKLKASRGTWIQRVPNMAVQIVKSNLADYYSKPEGDVSAVLAQKAPKFLTENPGVGKLIFGGGLVLELGALVMLLGRRWALVWGGALLLMHLGISWLMGIEFWNHIWLLLIFCVLPGIPTLFRRKV